VFTTLVAGVDGEMTVATRGPVACTLELEAPALEFAMTMVELPPADLVRLTRARTAPIGR